MPSLHLDPILVKRLGFRPVLPNAIRTHCTNDAKLIQSYCELSPIDAISLIRAARLYQDAIWIAEIDFILTHLSKPPDMRPPEFAQHEWNPQSLERSLRTIYHWRSRSLHNGTPFPDPMCNPPFGQENWFWEKPLGLASSSRGAVWVSEDTPMLLHLFEYIVRNALLLWWESMKKTKT